MGCCCGTFECCPGRAEIPLYADVWITADPTELCDGASGVLTWTAGACPREGLPAEAGYVGDIDVAGDNLHMVVCCPGTVDPTHCTGTGVAETPTAWLATFSDCGGEVDVNSSTGCGCCDVFAWTDPVIAGCGGCVTTATDTPVVYMQPRCAGTGTGIHAPFAPALLAANGTDPATSGLSTPSSTPVLSAAPGGPGTQLAGILGQLGFVASATCGCHALAARMDGWGSAGCKEPKKRALVLDWLRGKMASTRFRDKFRAGLRAAGAGMTFVRPSDVPGSLLDEAVRRAEAVGR